MLSFGSEESHFESRRIRPRIWHLKQNIQVQKYMKFQIIIIMFFNIQIQNKQPCNMLLFSKFYYKKSILFNTFRKIRLEHYNFTRSSTCQSKALTDETRFNLNICVLMLTLVHIVTRKLALFA